MCDDDDDDDDDDDNDDDDLTMVHLPEILPRGHKNRLNRSR